MSTSAPASRLSIDRLTSPPIPLSREERGNQTPHNRTSRRNAVCSPRRRALWLRFRATLRRGFSRQPPAATPHIPQISHPAHFRHNAARYGIVQTSVVICGHCGHVRYDALVATR